MLPFKWYAIKKYTTLKADSRGYGKENIQRSCLQEQRGEMYLTIAQFLLPLFSSFNSFNLENPFQTYGKTVCMLDSEFYLLFLHPPVVHVCKLLAVCTEFITTYTIGIRQRNNLFTLLLTAKYAVQNLNEYFSTTFLLAEEDKTSSESRSSVFSKKIVQYHNTKQKSSAACHKRSLTQDTDYTKKPSYFSTCLQFGP